MAPPTSSPPDAEAEHPMATMWASVVRSAGARILVLPVSAALGLLATRLIVSSHGTAAYAQYGMLVAFAALLPFTDLGMAAAVVNAVGGSTSPSTDPNVRRVLVTSIRVLLVSAAVVIGAAVVITAADLWPVLLGDALLSPASGIAAAGCVVLIGLSTPVSVGQRILTGLGRNHFRVLIIGLQSPLVLAALWASIRLDLLDAEHLAIIPYAVTLALAVVTLVVAARLVRPAMGHALRAVPRLRSVRGAKVSDLAWPTLIQMVAVPLAMQTDRLVLSHFAGVDDLAQYTLGSQLYLPVWQVVSAAGAALWPIFARARSTGDVTSHSPIPVARRFAVFGALACVGLTAASPVLVPIASNGQIDLSPQLLAAFSVLMVCQAAKYPLGMFLTDAPGLRFQAGMILLMAPTNLALSMALAGPLGAVGPVVGSIVGVAVFELGGNLLYVRRRLARTVASQLAAGSPAY